ncbi:c-type cytochrome (plasmid) [Roseomonas gilardii subsp. gilardii]|uniref:c-type cytochrome n=1 Tax=Roseomonas gilardii TaxID=257708 RepID=UPI001FF8248C|nr:cytochrome c [Roseomonas gilardii]UPG74579.1 c-type cytochrome [Roseomonas gilardii subsp. gilardii]
MTRRILWALPLLAAMAGVAAAEPGRALFQGHRPFAAGREATANRLPTDFAACAACHGADAAGRREGGIVAPPVTWAALARPAGLAAAYPDADAVRAAILSGIGRDGRVLDPAMPRYRLDAAETEALLAYLRVVGTAEDRPPGVTAGRVLLGTVLPLSGRAAATARAVLAGLEEGLAGMRVHGRRLELRVEDGAAGGTAEALRRLLGQPVFMLVGGLWQEDAGAEAILAQARVAHIGSLVARAGNDRTRSWTADLLAPRAMQQAMLAAALASCPAGTRLGLAVAPPGAGPQPVAWLTDPAALPEALRRAGGAGCLGSGLAGASPAVRAALPSGWRWQVVLPFPAALFEEEDGIAPWRRLGLVAARLAVEVLAQSGHALTERAPLDALPASFEALPGAPLRYGPRRRHGWDPELIELGPAARPGAAGAGPDATPKQGG